MYRRLVAHLFKNQEQLYNLRKLCLIFFIALFLYSNVKNERESRLILQIGKMLSFPGMVVEFYELYHTSNITGYTL